MRIWNSRADAADMISKADKARDARDWTLAAELYQEALHVSPNRFDIWVQLGHALKESGRLNEATVAYRKAIEIEPMSSDAHLQLGHALKLSGDTAGARQAYEQALTLDSGNFHAAQELGRPVTVFTRSKSAEAGRKKLDVPTIYFDISDLVFYLGHHDNLSGIQRVQCSILSAWLGDDQAKLPRDVGFISFDRSIGSYRRLDTSRVAELINELNLPVAHRRVHFDREAAKHGSLYPIANFPTGDDEVGAIVLLGAAWVIPDYATKIANLKRLTGMRFLMTLHDFIPIYARETCDQGTAEVFKVFMDQVLPLVDCALCVSENTRRDLYRYCNDTGIEPPQAVVTQNGSSFDEFLAASVKSDDDQSASIVPPRPYVLFVSTIEGRKNHDYLLQIWRLLLRAGVDVPDLVCVGRLGWRSEQFLQTLLSTNYLDGRVQLREDVSDSELRALYRGCRFTVYPSQYEGWGLPVGESLSYGKVCVVTKSSSLPEVAGDFCPFIPLNDAQEAAEVIRPLIESKQVLPGLENRIQTEYKPISWETVAGRVFEAYSQAKQRKRGYATPVLRLGQEFLFRALPTSSPGLMGNSLRAEVERSHRRCILSGFASRQDNIDGLLARDTHWHAPEDWGCWSNGSRSSLFFMLEDLAGSAAANLVMYASVRFSQVLMGWTVSVICRGRVLTRRTVAEHEAIIHCELPLNSSDQSSQKLEVEFRLVAPGGSEDLPRLPAPETRVLGLGIRSVVFLEEKDYRGRLAVLENLLMHMNGS